MRFGHHRAEELENFLVGAYTYVPMRSRDRDVDWQPIMQGQSKEQFLREYFMKNEESFLSKDFHTILTKLSHESR